MLRLSLKDFICEDGQRRLNAFEDVPLEIPSKTLHQFYRGAFRAHVMGKAEEMMDEVTSDLQITFTKVFGAQDIIREHGIADGVKRTIMEKEYLEQVKSLISQVQDDLEEIGEKMKRVESEMDKVDNKMVEVVEMRVKVGERESDLESKVMELTAEGEKLVELEGAPLDEGVIEAEEAPVEERVIEAEARDEEGEAGASQQQPTTSQTSRRRSSRAIIRSFRKLF